MGQSSAYIILLLIRITELFSLSLSLSSFSRKKCSFWLLHSTLTLVDGTRVLSQGWHKVSESILNV